MKLDIWDIVALNAWLELPYYDKWLQEADPGAADRRRARATIAAPSSPPAATRRTAAS